MQPPRSAGPLLLHAAARFTALAALSGCGTALLATSKGPASQQAPGCDAYADSADLYGYCLYKMAGAFPDPATVEAACTHAGDWEDECRHAWVAGQMRVDGAYDLETLLGVCAGASDCAFELVDRRPADDVLEQLDRCVRYTGEYARDCVGHALQLWYFTPPDAAEFARVAPAVPELAADNAGSWLAYAVACLQVGSCDQAVGRVQRSCRHGLDDLAPGPGSSRQRAYCPERTAPAGPRQPGGPGPSAPGASAPVRPHGPGTGPGQPQGPPQPATRAL